NFQFQRNWQPARNQQQVPSPPNNDAHQQGPEPSLRDLQKAVQDIRALLYAPRPAPAVAPPNERP
ncbi:unnamed protein product, partial [Allacma fusca]